MTLDELKVRLKMSLDDTSQDDYLQVTLDDSIDFVKEHCKSQFEEGLPGTVKRAVALLVKASNESNVASQSLGDMSKSFFKGATYEQALALLEPYVNYGNGPAGFNGKKVQFVIASSRK